MGRNLAGARTAHVCVDMQVMFAEETEWHAPWLNRILPAAEALTAAHAARTIFTRFIPPTSASESPGAWRSYYDRWQSMTLERLPPGMTEVVPALARHAPPAVVIDKPVYSPWWSGRMQRQLRQWEVDTLVITGGETDVCVLATLLGAIDLGYRVILPQDALYGSADPTHDAMLSIYRSRFGQQLTVCTTEDLLRDWTEQAA